MKQLKIYGVLIILLALALIGASQLSNPGGPEDLRSITSIDAEDWNAGSFEFDQLLYLSPLSSMTFDYAENRMRSTKYTISDELFEIDYPERDDYILQDPVYTREIMTGDMIRTFHYSTMEKVSISKYMTKYRYTIYTKDNVKTNYHLYVLDDELWLSSYADNTADKSEIAMYLWKLK